MSDDIDPNEVDESLGEDPEWIKGKKFELPEAPMSIHIDSYLNGFHIGWTKRLGETSLAGQTLGIKSFVKLLIQEGFKPSWNEQTNEAVAGNGNGEKCETCKAPALRKSGEKNGKQWTGLFCSQDKTHVRWG